ncbi:hypothetical protein P5G50_17985 [Leifsonia sp. F6_8S_P_1B]|uniref:WxL domain-containing protein n=1 Tax=Leifsonia williamsii TaxID=3035919 RepID=A0ABT8KFV3_9MICO|nr:hypothetical protein [Leifsonia williamsii]MDN4616343.1 hypothetical protein [Leifsonia williamsii]
MKKTYRIVSLAALVTGSLLVAPAALASTVTQAVTGGSLTASASDVTLPAVATAHTDQDSPGSLTITADDSTGTGAGWHVTEQVSDLVYSGSSAGTDIPASNLSITSVGAASVTAGQAIDTSGTDAAPTGPQSGNVTSGVTGTLDSPVTVFVAGPDHGQGTYTLPVDLNLTVPADSRVGTYSGTLTTTITSAP